MPAKQPINDEEFCGLIQAIIDEAQRAGFAVLYGIPDDGSLAMRITAGGKRFELVESNGSKYLTITAGLSPHVTADYHVEPGR